MEKIVKYLDKQRRLYKGGALGAYIHRKSVARLGINSKTVDKQDGVDIKNEKTENVEIRSNFPERWIFDSIHSYPGHKNS